MSRDIAVSLIDRDPAQPRHHFDDASIAELAQSLASKGLVVPIMVRPSGERFIIVHGERRWRAAQRLGWETIRAEVRDVMASEARWLALIENVQRQDLTPIEEALAYEAHLADGITQGELGERIGKSQSYIAQKLRLLTLPEPIQLLMARQALTEGHARQLLRLKAWYHDAKAPAVVRRDAPPLDQEMPETEAWGLLVAPLCRDIRPMDNPPGWINPGPDDTGRLLAEACRSFYGYARQEGALPQWTVTAFWYACATVEAGLSVTRLNKALSTWREIIFGAVAWCHLYVDEGPPESGLQRFHYWGHQSDLRHAGLSDWIRSAPKAVLSEAVKDVVGEGAWVRPSCAQPWGFQHKEYNQALEGTQWAESYWERWH